MTALTWGPETGRLALCVHGFPDSAHTWRHIAPALAANGFRVVAPFTRGYGPTGPAPDGDYHTGALMTDLVDLHRYLSGGDDAVLIGHDWGAWTTNALAASTDSPFGGYVSMALPPVRALDALHHGFLRLVRMMARQMQMSWYVLFFQLPLLPERVVQRVIPRLWRDWSPPGTDVTCDVASTLAALPSLAHRKAAVAYYRCMFRFTRPAAPYARLHGFRFDLPRAPLLVLHGEQDGAMQVGYLDGLIDALPRGSQVRIINGAGHFLQIDQPAAVSAAILGYLELAESTGEA